jgi:hypothetical protein
MGHHNAHTGVRFPGVCTLSSSAVPRPTDKSPGDGAPWWAGELSPQRREELLNLCADWVVRKRLEAPALMFLEMHKPLTTLASVSYTMAQPPLMLFFGFRRTEDLRVLLSDRDNVEALMQRIERHSKEEQLKRRDAKAGGR